jgi:hypothetical protein
MTIVGAPVTAISMSGADQPGGRVFVSGSAMSAVSLSGLSQTRVDMQANTGVGDLTVNASASVVDIGGCGVPLGLLGQSTVLVSDCWQEGARSDLFDLQSGTLTFLGGLLAPFSDGYSPRFSRSAPAVPLDGFAGGASFIGVSLNLRTGVNGILIKSASAGTSALFFGVSSNVSDFFTSDVTSAEVGAIFLKSYIPTEGAFDIPDVGDTSADFVASGFTQSRGVVWDTEPMAHVDGATDVRLFRLFTVDTAVGLSVSN